MNEPGTLINCEQALDLIRSTHDEALRNLLDMAFMAFVKDRFSGPDSGPCPAGDFDMAYCMGVLKSIFSDRDYVLRILADGEPERWFDDEAREPAGRGSSLDASALDRSPPAVDAATP